MKKPFQNAQQNKSGHSERFNIFVWSLYDFANTSFSIVVVTFIYAVYFKDVVAGGESKGDLYWSIANGLSMGITAIIAPILGAISDHSAGKKRFLLFFTSMCLIATGLLYFVGQGAIFFGILIYVLANVGYEASLVFYDSFLPEITAPKNYGRVSGYGYAFGYVGSLVSLIIVFPFIQAEMFRETFPVASVFFLIFALPLFFYLKDNRKSVPHEQSYVRIGFERVKFTLTHLRNHKNLALFLLSFFFFIEGVNTIIQFSGIYAKSTLQFTMMELTIFFIIVQTTAILGAIVFGLLADSIGQKKAITISLYIWIFTVLLAYFISDPETLLVRTLAEITGEAPESFLKTGFYFIGLIAGSVMGATQSVSRSLMSRLTPEERKTEFFGFYSFFGKSSAIVGPFVFGLTSYLLDSQRLAMLTVLFFFVTGLILLGYVKEPDTTEA